MMSAEHTPVITWRRISHQPRVVPQHMPIAEPAPAPARDHGFPNGRARRCRFAVRPPHGIVMMRMNLSRRYRVADRYPWPRKRPITLRYTRISAYPPTHLESSTVLISPRVRARLEYSSAPFDDASRDAVLGALLVFSSEPAAASVSPGPGRQRQRRRSLRAGNARSPPSRACAMSKARCRVSTSSRSGRLDLFAPRPAAPRSPRSRARGAPP